MSNPKPNVPFDVKNKIAQFLLQNSKNGKVISGKIKEASASFGVCRRIVQNIWVSVQKQVSEGVPVHFTSNKIGKTHKKQVILDIERMKGIPFEKRGTIRRLARELNISKSYVGRIVKEGLIKHHSNAIKPQLTEENKLQRLNFSLNALVVNGATNKIQFNSMHHVIHIDKKWFYMTQTVQKSYRLPEEQEYYRACKSKKFIPKIMFMCAVSRPLYCDDGQLAFDGKIGLYPFTINEPAQRNLRNRERGTMVTKHIDSINKEVIKNCILNQIIPDIKQKRPVHATKNIVIQQDNAKSHISNNDPDFRAAASSDGFNIQIVYQPPNSPDCNINDLGWFSSIQTLQTDTSSYTVDELVKNVVNSYEELKSYTLNKVFLTLQSCIIEMMKLKGHNQFKIPHMGKDRLEREGKLPLCLEVSEELVRECIDYLVEASGDNGLTYSLSGLMADLGYT